MATTNKLMCKNGKNKTGKQNRKSNKNLNNDRVHTLECVHALECDSMSPISNMISD